MAAIALLQRRPVIAWGKIMHTLRNRKPVVHSPFEWNTPSSFQSVRSYSSNSALLTFAGLVSPGRNSKLLLVSLTSLGKRCQSTSTQSEGQPDGNLRQTLQPEGSEQTLSEGSGPSLPIQSSLKQVEQNKIETSPDETQTSLQGSSSGNSIETTGVDSLKPASSEQVSATRMSPEPQTEPSQLSSQSEVSAPQASEEANLEVSGVEEITFPEGVDHSFLWFPVSCVENVIQYSTTFGLPWWGALLGVAIVTRIVVFPLTLYQHKNNARMQVLQPKIQAMQKEMQKQIHRGVPREQAQLQMKEFFSKNNINPFMSFLPALAQAPIFISCFLAIRELAEIELGFTTGGMLWFVDLSLPDPYWRLPILTGLTFLAIMELQPKPTKQTKMQSIIKYVMRGFAFCLIPLTSQLPTVTIDGMPCR